MWFRHTHPPQLWLKYYLFTFFGDPSLREEFNNNTTTTTTQRKTSERMETKHKCKNVSNKQFQHWFGDSSEEESGNETSENEEWNVVERENRNKLKRRRRKERQDRKISEVASKARRMAGIGPITDKEIDIQRKKTGNYETAKVWAVKSHLTNHYQYNQEELDALTIQETKRTNKDDIIYIAVQDEREIKKIYIEKSRM